jgi:hypothetical protein
VPVGSEGGDLYVLIVLLVLVLLPVAIPSAAQAALHHYEYVFPDNSIYVYDMDNRGALVKHGSVPTSTGVEVPRPLPSLECCTSVMVVTAGADPCSSTTS